MKKILIVTLITVINFIAAAKSEREEITTEKISELTTTNFNRTNEDIVLIGANGGPVISNPATGVVLPAVVAAQPAIGTAAIVPAIPKPSNKGRLLRHLLRERPGLLRRILRRKRLKKLKEKVIPLLPTVPGEEGVLPLNENSFEGSYVAVSGRPGQRTVHVVNGRDGNFAGTVYGDPYYGYVVRGQSGPGQSGHSPNAGVGPIGDYDYVFDLDGDGGADFYDGPLGARPAVPGFEPLGEPRPGLVTKKRNEVGFSPLPRCTYLNTDIYGDDVGDGKGISTGSAAGCKEACAELEVCQFWTYRDGWARDCYLKRGKRGDPTSSNAVPKVGYVSGTKGDICVCLPNSSNPDEEVCPISYSRPIYPWKPRRRGGGGDSGGRGGRCTDVNGNIVPCGGDNCFDENGIRIPGCSGGGGRRGSGGRGRDDGVYRYDYDDFDIPKTTTGGTTIGRSRCVDKNGIVIPCEDGVDDGLEVATARPIGGRRARPARLDAQYDISDMDYDVLEREVPGLDL